MESFLCDSELQLRIEERNIVFISGDVGGVQPARVSRSATLIQPLRTFTFLPPRIHCSCLQFITVSLYSLVEALAYALALSSERV